MDKEKFNRSIDNIDIPVEKLVAREKTAMFQGMKKRRVRRTTKSILVACGLCMTLLGSGFVSTGMAEALSNMPIIGSSLEKFVYSKDRSLQDYKTVIGESVEDNGMKVTLNEVILDEGQLLISSTFHTELTDEDLDYNWYPDIEIYMNGSELSGAGGGGPVDGITNSTVNYFWAADLQNIKLQDNQQIKVVFNNLERSDFKKVKKGKWSFEFTASSEELMENKKSIPIDKHFTLEDDQKVKVEELILTPVSTKLNYKMENLTEDVLFKLEDQNGMEIQEFSASTFGFSNYNRFVALEDHVTKLKVIPYIDFHDVDKDDKVLHDEIFEIDVK